VLQNPIWHPLPAAYQRLVVFGATGWGDGRVRNVAFDPMLITTREP
jgi:hypothetical protein